MGRQEYNFKLNLKRIMVFEFWPFKPPLIMKELS